MHQGNFYICHAAASSIELGLSVQETPQSVNMHLAKLFDQQYTA
ncbi:hypothetical protein [Janthinobacterium lividum]